VSDQPAADSQLACDVCGVAPCLNPAFCANCRKADRVIRGKAAAEVEPQRRAAASTVEALMYALRVGIEKLNPDRLRRLSELNEQQLHAVCERLRNFKPNIAPAWLADQIEALVTIWSELNERRREHERNR
jgi:hypothetical protein